MYSTVAAQVSSHPRVRGKIAVAVRRKHACTLPSRGLALPGQLKLHSFETAVLSEHNAGSSTSASELHELLQAFDDNQHHPLSPAGETLVSLASGVDPIMSSVIEEQGRIIEEKIAAYQKEAAEKAATLAYLQQGRDSEHKELLDTRAALEQALLQMEVLTQQAQVVDLLQQRINEQDQALKSLRTALNESNARRAMDTEATLANITELEEALALAQEQIERQPDVGLLEYRMEQVLVQQQELETEVNSLRAQLVLVGKAKTKAELDADRAWAEAKEKEAKLQKTLEQYNQLSTELTRLKRSNNKKKKGFLLLPSSDDMSEKVKQVEAELAAAQQAAQEKEASLQATNDELAVLKLQFSKQEERLQRALQELQELQTAAAAAQQAAAGTPAATSAAIPMPAALEETEKLQAQIKQLQKESSRLRNDRDKLSDETQQLRQQLQTQRKAAVEDAEKLRKAGKEEAEKMWLQLQQARKAGEAEVEKVQEEMEAVQSKLEGERNAFKLEVDKLRSKLSELEQVKQQLSNKDEQLRELERKLASSAQLDRDKMTQISQLLSEQKEAQQQVLEQQRVASNLQAQLVKRQQVLDVHAAEASGMKKALDTARSENINLRKKIEQQMRDLELLQMNDSEHAAQLLQATSVSAQLSKELQLVKANLLAREQELQALQQENPSRQLALANAYETQQQLEVQLQQSEQQNEALQNQVAQLYEQVQAIDQGPSNSAVEELLSLRDQLVEETKATAALLTKAETFTKAVTQQVRQGVAASAGRQQEDATAQSLQLAMKVEGLEEELAARAMAADEAAQRVEQLEEEMYWMSQEYSRLQSSLAQHGGSASPSAGPSAFEVETGLLEEVAAAQNQAMSAQAQVAALQQRVQSLEAELLRQQEEHNSSLASIEGAVRGDDRLSSALGRIAQLEEENARLQAASARREAVLNQSKKFIEQYLERSAQLFNKEQNNGEAHGTANGASSPQPVAPATVKAAATPATVSTRR